MMTPFVHRTGPHPTAVSVAEGAREGYACAMKRQTGNGCDIRWRLSQRLFHVEKRAMGASKVAEEPRPEAQTAPLSMRVRLDDEVSLQLGDFTVECSTAGRVLLESDSACARDRARLLKEPPRGGAAPLDVKAEVPCA